MKIEGKIEEASLKKGQKGSYWEFKISGRIFRLFKEDLFDQAAKLCLEQPVAVDYFDNEWGSNPVTGKPNVSHVINSIEAVNGFQKGGEVASAQAEIPIEDLMSFCVETAIKVTSIYLEKVKFTSDNVTSITNTLFIELNKRRR